MKRSHKVIFPSMDKNLTRYGIGSTVVMLGTGVLVGCGGSSDKNSFGAHIYQNISQCEMANPSYHQECEAAYKQAQETALKESPHYKDPLKCLAEFKHVGCYQPKGKDFYMPVMSGFIFSTSEYDTYGTANRNYYTQPLFIYQNQWYSAHGSNYGSYGGYRNSSYPVHINKEYDNYAKKNPALAKTKSRGGFGSTVAAQQSWSKTQKTKTAAAEKARAARQSSYSSSSRSSSRSSSWGSSRRSSSWGG